MSANGEISADSDQHPTPSETPDSPTRVQDSGQHSDSESLDETPTPVQSTYKEIIIAFTKRYYLHIIVVILALILGIIIPIGYELIGKNGIGIQIDNGSETTNEVDTEQDQFLSELDKIEKRLNKMQAQIKTLKTDLSEDRFLRMEMEARRIVISLDDYEYESVEDESKVAGMIDQCKVCSQTLKSKLSTIIELYLSKLERNSKDETDAIIKSMNNYLDDKENVTISKLNELRESLLDISKSK